MNEKTSDRSATAGYHVAPGFGNDWWLTFPERGRACRLYNAGGLDTPGEWYLDRAYRRAEQ